MKNRIERIDILRGIEAELIRFQDRLKEAMEDVKDEAYPVASAKFSACKRSALDLKKELTKLTQSSKYIWNR